MAMNGALTLSVWLPAMNRVTPVVKVCVPASAVVKVYDRGRNSGSLRLRNVTVPVNPGSGLPRASRAVTVTGRAVPAVDVVGTLSTKLPGETVNEVVPSGRKEVAAETVWLPPAPNLADFSWTRGCGGCFLCVQHRHVCLG